MMRYIGMTFALAMCAAFYFTPEQKPGQSTIAYLLDDSQSWQETVSLFVAAASGAVLLMGYFMQKEPD